MRRRRSRAGSAETSSELQQLLRESLAQPDDDSDDIARRQPSPRPDPDSGEPRPRPAPEQPFEEEPEVVEPAPRPKAPAGQGPALEWYRDDARWVAWLAAVALVYAVGYVLLTLAPDDQLAHWWRIGGVFAGAGTVAAMGTRRRVVAGGAEWLHARPDRWVRTYELVAVKLHAGGRLLSLSDAEGRTVTVRLRPAGRHTNPRLWDLVYNGMLHSAHARPLRTNRSSRRRLALAPNAGDPAAWMTTLPARRPDPDTGEPHPSGRPGEWRRAGHPVARLARLPVEPAGEGPVLEWHREPAEGWYVLAAVIAGVVILLGPDHEPLTMDGVGWLLTAIAVAAYVWALWMQPNADVRSSVVSAGAAWLAGRHGRWVNTYELVEVALPLSGQRLSLTDAGGRDLRLHTAEVRQNPLLWNLVHNGMVASIHSGRLRPDFTTTCDLDLPHWPLVVPGVDPDVALAWMWEGLPRRLRAGLPKPRRKVGS